MTNKPLIIFLGNSILSDDRAGLIIGERLRERLESKGNEVQVLEKSGVSLIDYLAGRDYVIIVDSMASTEKHVGEVVTLTLDDLLRHPPMSSHYLGLAESISLMNSIGIEHAKELRIIGIVVYDPFTISEKVSEGLERELPKLEGEIYDVICSELGQIVGRSALA